MLQAMMRKKILALSLSVLMVSTLAVPSLLPMPVAKKVAPTACAQNYYGQVPYNPQYQGQPQKQYQGQPLQGQVEKDFNQGGLHGQANNQSQPEHVLIILDASYSMSEPLQSRSGPSKMQVAKQTILQVLQKVPPHVNVGLRVYGLAPINSGGSSGFSFGGGGSGFSMPFGRSGRRGRSGFSFNNPFGAMQQRQMAQMQAQRQMQQQSCNSSELLVPIGSGNRNTIASQMVAIRPTGMTPIGLSLVRAAQNDFRHVRGGKKSIILVSDGIDTCGQDPCRVSVDLVRAGIDTKISVVGFGIHDPVANSQLKCIAQATFGKFYTANTTGQLLNSLSEQLHTRTEVQGQILLPPGQ